MSEFEVSCIAQICVLAAVHTEMTAKETEAKCMHCNTQYTQQASKAANYNASIIINQE